MFGVIASGKLVQTDFQQCGETKFATTVMEADSVTDVVVFLTGAQPFPPETAGLVYFSCPDAEAPPTWHLLGYISNDKPSAIFNIADLKKGNPKNFAGFSFGEQKMSHHAQIGISVEPLTVVLEQASRAVDRTTKPVVEFGHKMIENFVNYIASFTLSVQQVTPAIDENYVPLSALRNWYNNFERRLRINPTFWK
ncbi:protein OPI10 homolog [Schistocerca gregaria]|uniref:protein OPI10 homolog n=1 Tax=Schistocerca gregaria TaxID=7010 RepID=UPI00211EAD19|nr:protein OPI10 homolog [Schistocerca gregaria]